MQRTAGNSLSPSRLEIKTGQIPVTNCLGRMNGGFHQGPTFGAGL